MFGVLLSSWAFRYVLVPAPEPEMSFVHLLTRGGQPTISQGSQEIGSGDSRGSKAMLVPHAGHCGVESLILIQIDMLGSRLLLIPVCLRRG